MKTIKEIVNYENKAVLDYVNRVYLSRINADNKKAVELEERINTYKQSCSNIKNKIDIEKSIYSKWTERKNNQPVKYLLIFLSFCFITFIVFNLFFNWLDHFGTSLFWGIIAGFAFVGGLSKIIDTLFPSHNEISSNNKKDFVNNIHRLKKEYKHLINEIKDIQNELSSVKNNTISKEDIQKEVLLKKKKVWSVIDKWIGKNLDVDKFRNGDSIPHLKTNTEWEQAGKEGKPAWCYYNNDPANGGVYGKLYNWYAVNDPRGLAPDGWHIPSDEEWTELEDFLADTGFNYNGELGCGRNFIAKALASTSGWKSSNDTGTIGNTDFYEFRNKSGLTALPGGQRCHDGKFAYIGEGGSWWSSTESSGNHAWSRSMYYSFKDVSRHDVVKELGFSVRCVRD